MYCSNCGTQNADTNKFCIKCGTALPQVHSDLPVSPLNHRSRRLQNPPASAVTIGGLAGLVGGAIGIIGWLMPWTNVVVTSFSGLQITLTALNAGFAGLGAFQGTGLAFFWPIYLCFVITIVYGTVPLQGVWCIKAGLNIFERRGSTRNQHQIEAEMDRLRTGSAKLKDVRRVLLRTEIEMDWLRSRSVRGIVLVALIFLVPVILSALLLAAQPILIVGELSNLLPNSGYGSGFFVAAGGFVLTYIGARLARSQLDVSLPPSTTYTSTLPAASSTPVVHQPTSDDQTSGEK